MEVSPEQIAKAIKDEGSLLNTSPAILMAQNQHLNQRVILLRALVDAQSAEIERLNKKKPVRKTASTPKP